MKKVIGCIGIIIIGVVAIAFFLGYFICTTDESTNIMYDGFGRQLSATTILMRVIYRQERLWAGWGWMMVDFFVLGAGLVTGCTLAAWGFKKKELKEV